MANFRISLNHKIKFKNLKKRVQNDLFFICKLINSSKFISLIQIHFKLVMLGLVSLIVLINTYVLYSFAKTEHEQHSLNILENNKNIFIYIIQDFQKLIFLLENLGQVIEPKASSKHNQLINKINIETGLFKILSVEKKDDENSYQDYTNYLVHPFTNSNQIIKLCKEVCVIIDLSKVTYFLEQSISSEIEYTLSNQYFTLSNIIGNNSTNTGSAKYVELDHSKLSLNFTNQTISTNHTMIIFQIIKFAIFNFLITFFVLAIMIVFIRGRALFHILKVRGLNKELKKIQLTESLLKLKISIENKLHQIIQGSSKLNYRGSTILTIANLEKLLQDCKDYFSYDLINNNIQINTIITTTIKEIIVSLPLALSYQIIFSLMYYIIDILPSQSTIDIEVSENNGILTIEIKDNGFGFSLDQFKSYTLKAFQNSGHQWLVPMEFIPEILSKLNFGYQYLQGSDKGNIIKISRLVEEIKTEENCKVYSFSSYIKNNNSIY